jgi:phosphoenolpyruvate-protein phosphotransferase
MHVERILKGTPAAPGIATGPIVVYRPVSADSVATLPPDAEVARLDTALAQTDTAIAALEARLRAEQKDHEADIFVAHRALLGDPSLRDGAVQFIMGAGKSAAAAISASGEEQAQQLLELNDPYLSERAADVRDVVGQVARLLTGQRSLVDTLAHPAIVIAHDLGPSDLVSVPRERLLGFALVAGGLTAHATILARSLGIPAAIGFGPRLFEDMRDGAAAALDGASGELVIDPSAERSANLQGAVARQDARRAELWAQRELPSVTTDGHHVALFANAATPAEAHEAQNWGAEGVGLLRTELLFLDKATLPGEEEQQTLYEQVAAELPNRPIVVRTLDVGGDKSLPAFPLPKEENPFLGWRGIRIGLSSPEILLPQLRALLRAGARADIRIMLPMIATLAELRQARKLLNEAREQLAAEGHPHAANPQLGIMIEVPAAALMAEALAREADFFSIGTNDLTQYTLACDRTNERVAPLYQPLEPAVLRLIALTCEAAHRHGKHVAVCGELAGDPSVTGLLIGLGVDELSCSPRALPLVREAVRSLAFTDTVTLAQAVLQADSLEAVQALVAGGSTGSAAR